ncbi:UvrD-helicase domain-containing protein [Carboxylicivirga linearis]|uniref:DNA 3'-5' helicase n=1 Tax=Carboxylicivirga linearis TaxID=1628157 RepID=A0ABS5K1P6_9BACT|nr:UvrD-helicase domain-containing protein [Carboxylicivirga linearis]MBS2101053.1 ATP-dependent helicase [Carboxylicivirga linearis]
MQLTEEQKHIIETEGDLKVNAVAGSGKTTTILEYAKQRKHNTVLYIAFNKSVRLEAEQKLQQMGLNNVQVETAHSLAYKYIVPGSFFKIRFGYQPHEIAQILRLPVKAGDLQHLKLANHIYQFAVYFCNSAAQKVADLDYLQTIQETESIDFVQRYYDAILYYTRLFLAKMYNGEIEIIHDFYLKQFQLSNVQLPHQYILFDEGQDASPAMLQTFMNQKANKVIIGDQHQQIYSWRYAINALQNVDFKTLHLSQSFRFNHEVATLATSILNLKKLINKSGSSNVKGCGNNSSISSRATLARSNSSLLSRAIELLIQQRELTKIYFEGHLSSYTFADEGGSIYDILNLYRGERHMIKDAQMAAMPGFDELKNYVSETGNNNLKPLIDLVEKYHKDLPFYMKRIKDSVVDNSQKHEAEMIFSTVHKSKGMEYDEVFLQDDFINEQSLIDAKAGIKAGEIKPSMLEEEINLLYVATTRTKSKLHIPIKLLPTGFYVEGMKSITTGTALKLKQDFSKRSLPNKNAKWTKGEEIELSQLFLSGKPIPHIARLLGRSQTAIKSRIDKLDLWEKYY